METYVKQFATALGKGKVIINLVDFLRK